MDKQRVSVYHTKLGRWTETETGGGRVQPLGQHALVDRPLALTSIALQPNNALSKLALVVMIQVLTSGLVDRQRDSFAADRLHRA